MVSKRIISQKTDGRKNMAMASSSPNQQELANKYKCTYHFESDPTSGWITWLMVFTLKVIISTEYAKSFQQNRFEWRLFRVPTSFETYSQQMVGEDGAIQLERLGIDQNRRFLVGKSLKRLGMV